MSFKVEIPEIFYGSFIYWYETMVFTSVWNSFSWGKCFFKEFFMGINFIICIEILRPWNVLLTKFKQLQRCQNLDRYCGLQICKSCVLIGCASNFVTDIFTARSGKKLSLNIQSKVILVVGKTSKVVAILVLPSTAIEADYIADS